MRIPPLTLVIGGAASGKSAFAEGLALQSGLEKIYIATAEPFDAEMRDKIARHKADRAGRGWHTVEAPRAIAADLARVAPGQIALVDCLTVWLTNLMMAEEDWEQALDHLTGVLTTTQAPVIFVSNDVAGGIVPDNALARAFQRAQGQLNRALAQRADLVVNVIAGLPQVLKGGDWARPLLEPGASGRP